jgi:hypothetical protein
MLPLGFRHSWLGTEHLFLGIASPTDNPAGQVLSSLGMTVASARQALLEELGPPPSGRLLSDEDEWAFGPCGSICKRSAAGSRRRSGQVHCGGRVKGSISPIRGLRHR